MIGKIFSFLFMFSSIMYSQDNDVENKFISHLLEANVLILENGQNRKNYDPEKIKIELDTLDSNHYVNILFLKFEIGKNSINAIDHDFDIYFNSSSCDEYVLAYNTINHSSYRLKGFNGNDLLFLLKDLICVSYTPKSPKEVVSDLNGISIGVDFKAIYKALIKCDFEADCLKACSDGIKSH